MSGNFNARDQPTKFRPAPWSTKLAGADTEVSLPSEHVCHSRLTHHALCSSHAGGGAAPQTLRGAREHLLSLALPLNGSTSESLVGDRRIEEKEVGVFPLMYLLYLSSEALVLLYFSTNIVASNFCGLWSN